MRNIPRRLVLVICLALQLFWFTQVAVLKTGKAQIRMDDLLMNTKSFAEQIESPQVLNASTSRIDFTSMAKTRIEKVSGLLPISFESNEGQANSGVDFLSRGAGYGLFLKIAKILTSTQSTGPKIAFGSNRNGGNHEIYLMDIDGSNQIRITNNAAYDDQPKWSPDGSKIAFTSNRDGNFEIYSMNSDGTSQTRLTNNSAGDGFPVWSPDGTKIALVSGDLNNPSTFDIYVMNADGSNRTRLTLDALVDGVPSWSPDGSKLLFMSGPGSIFDPNSFEIFVMDADGTDRVRLTNNSVVDGQASFSPDGTKILFASGDALHPEGIEIFVMNPNGTGRMQLTNNSVTDGFPAWAAQGTKVILASGSINDEASVELFIMNADGSNRLRLTNNSALDWFADSQPAVPGATTVQFSASNYIVSEGSGRIDVSVTRSGDTSGTSTVDYITTDTDNFTVGCSQPSGGNAFGRCDFATSVDTLTFGPSETSKTFAIPIINDAIAEGSETFGVTLSNTAGATLGSPATATITITDNDAVTGPNPIFTTAFFVRQHYLDFLSREPERTNHGPQY